MPWPRIIPRSRLCSNSPTAYAAIDNPTATLQRLYITDNPHPLGEKNSLQDAGSGSRYDQLHAEFHNGLNVRLQKMDYYDIFLFDGQGNLVYTVFKELDFATNINTGEWKDTDLGNVYRAAMDLNAGDPPAFFDFAPYAPSADAPAAFIAEPVFDFEGRKIGVIAIQMPIARINAAVNTNLGLDASSHNYIVGTDGILRSDLPETEENEVLVAQAANPAIDAGHRGESGALRYTAASGHDYVAAYAPVDFLGTRWAIITEEEAAELYAPVNRMRNAFIILGLITAAITTFISLWMSRSVSRPLGEVSETMTEIGAQNYDVEVPHADRKDEIGAMAAQLTEMRDALKQAQADAQQAEAERLANAEREREREVAEMKRQKEAQEAEEARLSEMRKAAEKERVEHEAEREKQAAALAMVVENLANSLRRLAEGELDVTIEMFFDEQYKPLRLDFNAAMKSLKDIVKAIAHSASDIGSNVTEIEVAAKDLAHRTESSADAINETSSTMGVMTSLVEQTTDGIQSVRKLTHETKERAKSSIEP